MTRRRPARRGRPLSESELARRRGDRAGELAALIREQAADDSARHVRPQTGKGRPRVAKPAYWAR